jgi:hypothetical protein
MGFGSLIAGALKRVPWTSLAMNYGPELMRRFGGKVLSREEEPQEDVSQAEAEEMIRQLQALCDEQREINLRQQEQIDALNQACVVLQAQVKKYQVIAGVCAIVAFILAVVLLVKL